MVRAGSEPFWQFRRRQQALDLTRREGILIGLLIAATFVGSFDALRPYFVTGTQPQKEKPASMKIQDRLIATVERDTARSVSLAISEHSDSNPKVSVAEVGAFSVSNIRPTGGFIMASKMNPAPSTQQVSAASPTFVSLQSRIASDSHAVPLPRRKPKGPITKEAQTTTAKPMDHEQGEQMPKPMAFGSIGYNYDPQR